ncbi:MAG: class I SAM-dependent methyltransferase [Patescibacteria group bacterium]|nr:class I SAM-dependent methyltransferase [Patescibacteria group bacterium]MBU2068029.1 class I SAM-dependent methyltransferase [Patescibacteria group bacterium]MBU2472895.1 class I SAM-dependent methyltransferase [Patescibacteria group bacterium]
MIKWEKFFDDKIKEIAKEKKILDIGGGFRFQKDLDKYQELFKNSDYKTLDIEASYQPDIIGDVCNLPLEDKSVDAIICKAVLEHVKEPGKAAKEIYRVLKDSGKCLVYVPFLYPYHAHKGGYKDYYRYTKDGIKYLFRDFNSIEICPVRGNLETVFNLTPLRKIRILTPLIRFFDKFFSGQQPSGYHIYLIK